MMNYSNEQLNNDIESLNHIVLRPIRVDRGGKYGSSTDTLANVREADWFEKDGWRGALGSMIECKNRIQNYAKLETSEFDEKMVFDFLDACHDLINYSFYIPIMFNQKRNEIKEPVHVCACAVNPPKVVPWAGNVTIDPISNEVT